MEEKKNIKVLLSDDEVFILRAYKEGLKEEGYDVITAEDGEKTVELAKSFQPDVILLDLIMPKMNGFDTIKALKSDEKLKSIPVVIMSNLSQDADEKEVRDLGAVDFIIKSDYSLHQIIEKVNNIVKEYT